MTLHVRGFCPNIGFQGLKHSRAHGKSHVDSVSGVQLLSPEAQMSQSWEGPCGSVSADSENEVGQARLVLLS